MGDEEMETANALRRRLLPRCSVCRLPADTLAEVHRERLAWGATYDQLAEKLRASGQVTSTSALRRHFRSHVRDVPIEDGEAGDRSVDEIVTPFDALVGQAVDDRAVAEAMVQTLLEQVQRLERARRATRDGVQAERLMARSLKEIAALDRALRRWEEIRKPREELRAKVKETFLRIAAAVGDVGRAFMLDHVALMERAVEQYLQDDRHPELLVRRLREFKHDWSDTFASRVLMAVKAASKETLDSLR